MGISRTTIVNITHGTAYDIYIGRPSKWGNPFSIGIHGSREQVIDKYRNWIIGQKHLMNSLEELRGKRLGCFCWPKKCHGDVLIELLQKKLKCNKG